MVWFLLWCLVGEATGWSATVNLKWDANPEPDVINYRLYRGSAPGRYDWMQDAGLSTQITATELQPGLTYYFAVTAWNEGGLESLPSNEVAYTVPESAAGGAPVAAGGTVEVLEDGAVDILLEASDPDGDLLRYTVFRGPLNGKLTGEPPALRYEPAPNFFGTDQLEFQVSDGLHESEVATVLIRVVPVNDAPVADARSLWMLEDGVASIVLTGSDVEGSPLSFEISRMPTSGTLSGTPPLVFYQPRTNYFGRDTFEFRVSDGVERSVAAVVTVNISGANDTPVAVSGMVTVLQDDSADVVLLATDPDGTRHTFSVTRAPARGVLTGTPPQLVYTPFPGFYGEDFLEFVASDGYATSAPGRMRLVVTRVNQPPTALSQAIEVPEGEPVSVQLAGTDPDGDTLEVLVTVSPLHGALQGTPPQLTYVPEAGFLGEDSFTFVVSDGQAVSEPAVVRLTVVSANRTPEAVAASFTVAEDSPTTLGLSGRDPDGDPLTYRITKAPQRGTLTGQGPDFLYTPATNVFGTDRFEFTCSDGTATSAAAVVTIEVTPVNDPPVAVSRTVDLAEDTAVSITVVAEDPDSPSLEFRVLRPPAHGTLSGAGPVWEYTPAGDYAGEDSFEYTASDEVSTSLPAVVRITVTPVDDAPTALAGTWTLLEDTPTVLTLVGQDPDGDSLTYTITKPPQFGKLTGSGPDFLYVSYTNYFGTDGFEFVCSDGRQTSAVVPVSIEIAPVNDAPLAFSASVVTAYNMAVPIRLAAADSERDPLTYRIVAGPKSGTLGGTAPSLFYTPRGGFSGEDEFTFVVNDGLLDSGVATMRVRVVLTLTSISSLALIPTTEGSATALSGDALLGDGLLGDGASAASGSGTSVQWVAMPEHGVVDVKVGGTLEYRPFGDGAVLDTFSYLPVAGDSEAEPVSVAVHTITVEALERAAEGVQVAFPVIEGPTYSLEVNDALPRSEGPGWETIESGASTGVGIARMSLGTLPMEGVRYARVRGTESGLGQSAVSEVWGAVRLVVPVDPVGRVFSVPVQGKAALRVRVVGVEPGGVVLEGPLLEAVRVDSVLGHSSHVLVVVSSADGAGDGEWWPVIGATGNRVVLDSRGEVLESRIRVGDEVEVRKSLTLAEVFGMAGGEGVQLGSGDRIGLEGGDGGACFVDYWVSNRGTAGYWLERGAERLGPFDGSTIPLLPAQPFYFVQRRQEGVLTFTGRVQAGPFCHYLRPGVRMAGNAFPGGAAIPELSGYAMGDSVAPWLMFGGGVPGDLGGEGGLGTAAAAGGVWVGVPESSGTLRWKQSPPW